MSYFALLQSPGSARVSRVGFGVAPKRSFLSAPALAEDALYEVRDGETPLPTRETRALPKRRIDAN